MHTSHDEMLEAIGNDVDSPLRLSRPDAIAFGAAYDADGNGLGFGDEFIRAAVTIDGVCGPDTAYRYFDSMESAARVARRLWIARERVDGAIGRVSAFVLIVE